jgi:small-conductance mechanosensitive channel
VIGTIYLAQLNSPEIREAFVFIMRHMPSLFFVVLVVFIALIIVRLISRFGEYLRGNLKRKPQKVAPPGTLEFVETILKYTIYVVAGLIALIGGLALLPAGEGGDIGLWIQNLIDMIDPAIVIPLITSIVLLLFITFIISKIMDTFYEDLHRHSRKYSARVNDILKGMSKNILYIVAMIVGVFIVLSKFLSYTELLLTLGIVILLIVLVAFLASDIIKNYTDRPDLY